MQKYSNIFKELSSDNQRMMSELNFALKKGYEDPVFFNEYFLGIKMHKGQEEYLRNSDVIYNPKSTRKFILAPCNRWGKTLALATKHIRYNFYKIGLERDMNLSALRDTRYFTLDLSPHSNQVIACYNYIFDILHNRFVTINDQGKKTTNKCKIQSFYVSKNDGKNRISFNNGSHFYGASTGEDQGASLAGRQFGYISYDECVFCYSEDTQVLTANGWKYFNQVKIGEGVYSFNKDNEKVEMAKVKEVIWEDYNGKMVEFGSYNKSKVDLLVTPNHKMMVRKSKGANQYGDWEMLRADSLLDKHFKLNQNFDYKGEIIKHWKIPAYYNGSNYTREEKKIPIKVFLEFLGFYISEGCMGVASGASIQLSQMPYSKGYDKMKSVLDKLGLSYTKNRHGFRIFDKQFCMYIKGLVPGHSYQKRIPRSILDLDKSLLKSLYITMMLGDGTDDRVYITSSQGLSEDVEELCLKLGFIPTTKEYNRIGEPVKIRNDNSSVKHKIYYVSIRKGEKEPSINHHKNKYSTVKKVDYKGKIGCVTLDKNHVLLVKRNNRVCWSGNSHHLRVELPGRIMSRTVDLDAPIDLVSTYDTEAKSQQYYFGLVKKALQGRNDWGVKIGTYTDNFFIPADVKEKAKTKILNEDFNKYRQVFLGEAVPGSTKVLEPEVVDNIFKDKLTPQEPMNAHEYLISADWGGSDQGDPTIFLVFDITSRITTLVHHEEIKGGSPTLQFAMLKTLKKRYNDAKIIMDTNALGGVIIKKMLKEMDVQTYDFKAHGGEKGDAIVEMKLALTYGRKNVLEDGKMKELNPEYGLFKSYPLGNLEDQLGAYEVKDEKLEQDYVVCVYQAMWFLSKKRKKDKKTTHLLKRRVR